MSKWGFTEYITLISCIGTFIGAYFTYRTYRKASDIDNKITNQNLIVNGKDSLGQQHLGTGDNIAGVNKR